MIKKFDVTPMGSNSTSSSKSNITTWLILGAAAALLFYFGYWKPKKDAEKNTKAENERN